jgi:hypothetical protein
MLVVSIIRVRVPRHQKLLSKLQAEYLQLLFVVGSPFIRSLATIMTIHNLMIIFWVYY